MRRVLAARQDNNGDVLLTGPALRAIAAQANVTLLCGPRGAPAARLLPGIDDVIVNEAEWIDAHPAAVDPKRTLAFIEELRARSFDEALIFTSFHQSPLPLALLLRLAGVRRIGAISVDYPGSLLDVRHNVDDDIHEVERALSLARAMSYEMPAGDDARLRLQLPSQIAFVPFKPYVVVHPGATVPARAWFPRRNAALVQRLAESGMHVVVTGGPDETRLTAYVAGDSALDLGGKTSFAQFGGVVASAEAVICGNTAAAHVAAAVGTPVISIFPPTIPAVRFRPWMVSHHLLGEQHIACCGCRARMCPIPGQPCLDGVRVDDVLRALEHLLPRPAGVA